MGLLLSKYVDNEATPDERRRVEEHLKGCGTCRETLSIFLRNESMVTNAVAKDEFREKMIDRVMEEIEGPTEAEPAEATRWERVAGFLRERPWLQIAAALVIVAGIAAALSASAASRIRALREEVAALKQSVHGHEAAVADSAASAQRHNDAVAARMREMHQDLMRERLKNAHDIPGNSSAAAFMYDAIVVRARFAGREHYVSYSVLRSDDDGKNYRELKSGLLDSEYEDSSVEPGKVYWYRFVAIKANSEKAESVPVRLQAPLRGGLDPEKCLRIRCVEIGPNHNIATFAVTRLVNRVPVTYTFTVLLGQTLGRTEHTPHGAVDFSTGLELDSVEQGDETMKVTFAWPKFDPETKEPIYDRAGQQAYELQDKILSIRPNKRAVLRPAGTPSGRGTLKIWRDGEALVPVERK
ncbi:MAG: zf-HC2 domain-containing protein [Planctomycetes bacterium]|nr:zf-HC2 domain-containing protein [Planctomycetota bacterium]